MRRVLFSCILLLVVSALVLAIVSRAYAAEEDEKQQIGRYQVYAIDKAMVLLDTVTGKIWKISVDMAGKIKAEGITVEGLAYSNADTETLQMKMKEISLEGVSDKDKNKCIEELVNKFSYRLDAERAKKITGAYKKQ